MKNQKFHYITIEHGRGETYVQGAGGATVYGHDEWPSSSVLSGQSRRTYLKAFEADLFDNPWADARKWAEEEYPGVEVIDSGCSHVPIREMVAHLPDDGEGYDDWPESPSYEW